jgi:hypothetical protein
VVGKHYIINAIITLMENWVLIMAWKTTNMLYCYIRQSKIVQNLCSTWIHQAQKIICGIILLSVQRKKKKKLSQGAFSIVPPYDKGKKLKFLVRFFVFWWKKLKFEHRDIMKCAWVSFSQWALSTCNLGCYNIQHEQDLMKVFNIMRGVLIVSLMACFFHIFGSHTRLH